MFRFSIKFFYQKKAKFYHHRRGLCLCTLKSLYFFAKHLKIKINTYIMRSLPNHRVFETMEKIGDVNRKKTTNL